MDDGDSSRMHGVVSFGPFRLFAAERQLKKGDEPLQLGGRALDTLIALVERAGEVVTQRELISRVWPDVTVEEANLRVHIASLRKTLGDGREGARYIVTVPGRGYSFVAPVTLSTPQLSPSREAAVSDRLPKLPPKLTRMIGRDDTIRALSAQLMMSSVRQHRRCGRHRKDYRRHIRCPRAVGWFQRGGFLRRSGCIDRCQTRADGGRVGAWVYDANPGSAAQPAGLYWRQEDPSRARQLRACDRRWQQHWPNGSSARHRKRTS